jgi:hypothetical protein
MTGASKELLQAGCIYEYARESPKLRGLLVLMNSKRNREPFEIVTLPRTGKSVTLYCSFEDLEEKDARRAFRGALYWLQSFADELANNTSFADLLRTKGKQANRSLAKRPLYFPKGSRRVGASHASRLPASAVAMAAWTSTL